ncbi:MAG TPA: DUF3482 domain-containing protein [Ramlibacter sp.]|nr:DUF3482 domain-containing protein [Ramlibacter sp.]
MDESAARRALLARAIESTDGEGHLLAPGERDQVDLQARQEALQHERGRVTLPAEDFIALRARHVLARVAVHHPQLAALQEPRPWQAWLEWLVPIGALVVGVATDAIGNPHRVDLVSLPLLGIVAWNVAMYSILFASLFMRKGKPSWLAGIGRWSDGALALRRKPGDAAMQAGVRFHMDWFRASQSLHVARIKRVLHLAAASWALGVILSLLVRGLVVEYRVGWESTFLGPEQVYEILRVLRVPALLVFPFDTFSVIDVAQLRFSDGGGAQFGGPWVWMYVALLVTVVILPRLLLATWAAWQELRFSRALPVDLAEPYFERVAAMLNATRVRLGLLSHRGEDRERFLRAIGADPAALPVLVSSAAGDAMRLVDVPAEPPPEQAQPPSNWWDRIRSSAGWRHREDQSRDECDVVVHLLSHPGDEESGKPVLDALAAPVVKVQMGEGDGLQFAHLSRVRTGERALLDAIAQALPQERRAGFEHIVRAWEARSDERLHQSMTAVAEHALFAARQLEEVQAGQLSAKSIFTAEREAQASARQEAMNRIAARIDASGQSMAARLRQANGVADDAAAAIEHRLEERFVVQQPVDASHAGMAGAATGAAMGASVDLLAGGLTLGAAAALGAVVGGGAAFIAAAWKNRASPTGATIVQLSDEMLDALVEAALLRYIAIAHWARGTQEVDARWKAEVTGRVQAQKLLLAGYWNTARTQPNPDRLVPSLAHELDSMAKAVLKHINP